MPRAEQKKEHHGNIFSEVSFSGLLGRNCVYSNFDLGNVVYNICAIVSDNNGFYTRVNNNKRKV